MRTIIKTTPYRFLQLTLGIVLILSTAGCGGGGGTVTIAQTATSDAPVILPTLATPVMATPKVQLLESTAVPLNLKVFHPDLEKNVAFSFDDQVWTVSLVGSGPRLLHDTIEDCYIVDRNYSDTGYVRARAAERAYLAGVNWDITNGIFYTYEAGGVELELGSASAHQDEACRSAQEAVLDTMSFEGETLATEAAFPTYTPLPDYYCPLAPDPRLKEGQEAITTVEVILRSTPEKLKENIIRKVTSGVRVKLEEGPVCGEFTGGAYVYWRVTIVRTGEEGWLAEAGYGKYYLEEYEEP